MVDFVAFVKSEDFSLLPEELAVLLAGFLVVLVIFGLRRVFRLA